jgi:hypothetical protein
MALQHLRSSTANKRPTPGAMSDGQLALNTNLVSPGLFFKDSNGDVVKVGPVHVGTTAPNVTPGAGGQAGNSKGEQWLDTSSSRYVFKIWDGTAWRSEDGEFVNVSGDTMTGALGIIAGTAAAPGVFFSGDPNTGIYRPGADQLAVATNGTGRLLVDASGNVGVGVAPSVRLQVQNSIAGGSGGTIATLHNFSDAGGDTRYTGLNFVIGSDNGTSAIRAGRTNSSTNYETNLSFWTNPTGATQTPVQRMTLDSTGRLGVGTSIPGSFNSAANQLVVGNGSADQGLTVYTGTANQGSIFFADGTTGGAQQAAGYIIYPHSGDYMAFGTANTERLRITSAGLVGIGSSSPASKLTVAGTQGNFRVDPDSVSNEVQLFATVPNNSGFINYRIRAYQLFVDTSGVTALTIDSSQRVGIGSSSPGYALDVVGTVNSNALFRASNGTHIALLGSEAFSAGVVGVGSGSNHPLVLGTNSAERARIDTSGRLLVGTSSSPSVGQGQYSRLVVQGYVGGDASSGYMSLARGEGAANITSGETLGVINFTDNAGNTFAQIISDADANAGASDYPGRLVFSTTADGAASPTERMRITSDAYVRLASGTGGIQFNGDTAAANALDDYEEGTFTPVLNGVGSTGTGTYTLQQGRYTKIGRTVSIDIVLTWTAHTGTGTMYITGIPFTFGIGFGYRAPLSINTTGVSATVAYGDGAYGNISVPTTIASSGTIYINGTYTI